MKDGVHILIGGDASGIDRATRQAASALQRMETTTRGLLDSIKGQWLGWTAAVTAATATFVKGFRAVDDFKTSVASLSAVVLTFAEKQKGMDIGGAYQEAHKYATALVPQLEKIAASTLLSGQQTMLLNVEFSKFGTFLDANNAKAVEGFKSFSNALAVMTQGQNIERQIMSEVKALMGEGSSAGAMMLSMLKQIDPKIREHIALWKEEGTLLEHLGDLLQGFGPATAELSQTWSAVSTTIETTVTELLRGGMTGAYNEIMALLMRINEFVDEHKETVQTGMLKAWQAVKATIESIVNLLEPFIPIVQKIGQLTGVIAEGWGLLVSTILPPLTERIGLIVKSMLEWVALVGNLGSAFWKLLQFDFSGALAEAKAARENFRKSGELAGQAFSGGFVKEIEDRYREYSKRAAQGAALPVKPPKPARQEIEQQKAAVREVNDFYMDYAVKTFHQVAKAKEWLTDQEMKYSLTKYDYERFLVIKEYEEKKELIGEYEGFWEAFNLRMTDIAKREEEERLRNLEKSADKAKEIVEESMVVPVLSFTDGWRDGLRQWEADLTDAYENGRRLADDAARSFTGAFQEMFFGNFRKGLDMILDYFKRVLAQMIAQAIANPIIVPIVTAVGGLLGTGGVAQAAQGILGGNGAGLNLLGGNNPFGGLMSTYLFGGGAYPGYAGVGMNMTNAPGILGTGQAYGTMPGITIGNALGTIGGLYGMYSAYKNASPGMGALSGGLAGYSIGSMIGSYAATGSSFGPWGLVIGAIVGAIAGALGKKPSPPKTAISYDPDRASGAWAIRHEELFPAQAAKSFKDSMERWRFTLKDFMEAIGGDISRFDQAWQSGRASMKKKNTVDRLFDFFFSSYTEWVTGIDFDKFAKDGEKLNETITAIVSSVMTIESVRNRDVAAAAGMNWNAQELYDSINLQGMTFAEGIADFDRQITDAIDALSDLSGVEYRNQLELLGGLIIKRYEAEVQYLTYIKGLAEGIARSIQQQIEGFQLDVMSPAERVEYYNKRLEELYNQILLATDPTQIENLVSQIQQIAQAGWGTLSEEDKKRSVTNITDFLEEVNRIAQEKLAGAVTAQQTAIDRLIEQISKIDYSPLGALAKSAQDAADALAAIPAAVGTGNIPAHAGGLDYVPRDNYVANLHRGEAVITAQGNTALAAIVQKLDALLKSDRPVQVVVSGDMAQLLRISVNGTVQTLQQNPGLLAR